MRLRFWQCRGNHDIIKVSISGGSDSDVVLDLIEKVKGDKEVHYVWFDTGLEYQATKDHLDYLESKYAINIERERAVKPIPVSCKEYGQPFLSKYVSEQIGRLQSYNFKWEDKPYEKLVKEYPKCVSAIKWWCNQYTVLNGITNISWFDIGRNKYLKEFLIKYPPNFPISNKCCKYAKKKVAEKYDKEMKVSLVIIGVRKAEGGIRSIGKTCYDNKKSLSKYRPVFWYSNSDKEYYEEKFNIIHSKCYTKYGLTRTGCVGCPYNQKITEELAIIETFEPKLYKACTTVFKKSYEYTRKYREFVQHMKEQEKQIEGQMTIYDYLKE